MPKGFAQPYLILAVLVIVGVGIAIFAGSQDLAGFVLGAKSHKENIYQNNVEGLKVTVISPSSSWDLLQYLCKTRNECETSLTSGKWWATVSGAPTTEDGHEVFIEKSDGWSGYPYIKLYAKSSGGVTYRTLDSQDPYFVADTTLASPTNYVFVANSSK